MIIGTHARPRRAWSPPRPCITSQALLAMRGSASSPSELPQQRLPWSETTRPPRRHFAEPTASPSSDRESPFRANGRTRRWRRCSRSPPSRGERFHRLGLRDSGRRSSNACGFRSSNVRTTFLSFKTPVCADVRGVEWRWRVTAGRSRAACSPLRPRPCELPAACSMVRTPTRSLGRRSHRPRTLSRSRYPS